MCPLFDLDFVYKYSPHVTRIRVIERIRKLVRNVSVESPTKCHVQYLATTTNAKKRLAVRRGSLDHLPFNRVTLQIHIIDARVHIARRIFESNVAATGKENSSQAGIDRIPSIVGDQRGNENWHTSRLHHRIDIRLHEHNRGIAMYVGGLICCNSNYWFHNAIVKQKDPKGVP